jgi:PIN domain nuclease of toxin-antitoxin system
VRLLLDTHALLWALDTPARLRPATREAIESPANSVLVSAASAWEIAIKQALGRLDFPLARFDALLVEAGLTPLPISSAHAVTAGHLPPHHRDPFDRMLVAQALREDAVLVTDDAAMAPYGVARLAAS